MDIKVTNSLGKSPTQSLVKVRCPKCRRNGTFEALNTNDVAVHPTGHIVGVRRCPDPDCYALLFFASKPGGKDELYPPETIDFDATSIPTPIQRALDEAIKCHAQRCFVAAAIIVRKTLA